MSGVLRQAIAADIPAISIVRYAVRENTLRPGIISDEDIRRELEDTGRGWVVEVDDRIVAFAIGNATNANIWALFVRPDAEHRGHGRRLHDEMVKWLWSRDLQRLWLETGADTRARGFYASLGWQYVADAPRGQVRLELRAPRSSTMSNHAAAHRPFRPMLIKTDDLTGPEIHALLEEHLRAMHVHSPPESVHALDIEALRAPSITFWTAWQGDALVGCGALREMDPEHAEIKSMRTATAHLRRGVARTMLAHIVDEATRRGYRRLYLETGSMEAFEPARRLYASFGFVSCGPFADYALDANSVFMTKEL